MPVTAVADMYSVLPGVTSSASSVITNDFGSALSVSAVNGVPGNVGQTITLPSGASVNVQPGGTFSFTSAPNSATETFNYTATDGFTSDSTTVTINVGPGSPPPPSPGNTHAPVAFNKQFQLLHDKMLFSNLATSDYDADGDSLHPIIVTQPQYAQLFVNDDGSINLLPDSRFVGVMSFSYKETDGIHESNEALVTITYTNSAPIAHDVHFAALQDQQFMIREEDLTGHAYEADWTDDLWVQDYTQPVDSLGQVRGSMLSDQAGNLIYTPEPGAGDVSFAFTLTDGVGLSNWATAAIHAALAMGATNVTAQGPFTLVRAGRPQAAPTVRNTGTTAGVAFAFASSNPGDMGLEFDERFLFSINNPTFRISSSADARISSVNIAGTVYNVANPASTWELALPANLLLPGRFTVTATISFTGDRGPRTVNYEIQSASFATPRTSSQTVQVQGVALTNRRIVAGFYRQLGDPPIQQNATVRVETALWTNRMLASIRPDLATVAPLIAENYQRGANQRLVTFPILANRPSTLRGDIVLRVFVAGADVEDTVPITVVVPTRFLDNNYPITANVGAQNRAVGPTTSPRMDELAGQPIPANMLARVIAFIYWDRVQILDQFRSTLNAIYTGTDVREGQLSINQRMQADGTYLDPVGKTTDRISDLIHVNNNAAIQAWESAAPNPNDLPQDGTVIRNDPALDWVEVAVADHIVGRLWRRAILTFRN